MKKTLPEFLLFLCIGILLYSFPKVIIKKEEVKLKPYEDYYLIRNYPDGINGYDAYQKNMQKAAIASKNLFKNAKNEPVWITQGPYNIGGRINTIAVNPENTNIIYVGTVCGGIFKTIDGGENWVPIFDDNAYLAIAHIHIDPHNSNTIYVGTGDPNISGYPWIGNGVYRSNDGGDTWENLGLNNVGIVSKVAVSNKNSNIIYAATMGIPFERDENRGLYKSINGGESWDKVLFLSNDAGIIDMLMLPNKPDTLFVAGWNRIRNYNESVISGEQCKIYRTFNGGESWDTLKTNLPQGGISRIGLCLSLDEGPEIVAQLIESTSFETEGIYKSADFGDSWDYLNSTGIEEGILGNFGWYFGKIRVNPFNKNQFFILGVDLYRSDDGGQSYTMTTPPWYEYSVHADKHDLVFIDSSTIILATDGGLYKSIDGGHYWDDFDNIPNTQFYRIAVDPHNTGFYAGGAQDNGTNYGNIADSNNWIHLFGGDGFQPLFDKDDANLIYCETQNGSLYYGVNNGDYFEFNYFNDGIDEADRRSWDMPFAMSPINSKLLYTGTYRVYENRFDESGLWEPISYDLTDGTENKYHVISAIDPSSKVEGYVMTGSSDGKVYVYNNDEWKDISTGLPVRYVTCTRMSPNNQNNLFVSHSGYKANEFIPHIHFSDDFGQNWTDISGNLPQLAINSIFVLNNYGDSVIFVATDGGVYHTLDRGGNWERSGANMPIFPVYDLAYEDTTHTLVAGTFARSIMTLELNEIIAKKPAASNIAELDTYEFNIYPNPAKDWIEITLPINPESVSIIIKDMAGRQVSELELKNELVSRINVSTFEQGTYIVSVIMGNKIVASRKIIKE